MVIEGLMCVSGGYGFWPVKINMSDLAFPFLSASGTDEALYLEIGLVTIAICS